MADSATGETQLYDQNRISLNALMSNDDYMKAELEAENELLLLQGFDDDELSMSIMNDHCERYIKPEPDNEQVSRDTHRESVKQTDSNQTPATKTSNQGQTEIKKVQFTDVKIANHSDMLKDVMNDKMQKTVFLYPVSPQDMSHPTMKNICKMCVSFSVNFHISEIENTDQMIGILVMKLRYVEGYTYLLDNVFKINKELIVGAKNKKVNHFTDFYSKYGLETAKKPEHNARGYLYVANVPSSATEEELEALFPGAKFVILARDANGQRKGYAYVSYDNEEVAKDALYSQLTFPMMLHQHQLVVFYYSDPVSHRRQVGMKLPSKMKPPVPSTVTSKARPMSEMEKEKLKKQLLELRHEINQVRGVNEGKRQEIGRKMQTIERKLASEKTLQPLQQQKSQERLQDKPPRKPQQEQPQRRPHERPQQEQPQRRPHERPQQGPQIRGQRKPLEHPRPLPQGMPPRSLLHGQPEHYQQPPIFHEPPMHREPLPQRRPQQLRGDDPAWMLQGHGGGALKRKAEPPCMEHPMSSYASSYIAIYGNEKQNAYSEETDAPPERQPRWDEPQPPQVPSLFNQNYLGRPNHPQYPFRQDDGYMSYEREPPTDGVGMDAVNLLLGITEVFR